MIRIACIGEAMVELALDEAVDTAKVGFAGDALNTAVYMARALPRDASVSFVSKIGVDPLSNRLAAFCRQQGVDVSSIQRDESRLPGVYSIVTDPDGERSFLYWREQSAARKLFDQDSTLSFEVLAGFDVIYVTAITLAILPASVREALLDWISAYRQRGGVLVFDSNYRPKLWHSVAEAQSAIEKVWRLTDIGLPSLDDEILLFSDRTDQHVMQRLRDYAMEVCVLKRGPCGPLWLNGEQADQPFPAATEVVDTTAAGDSFNAGFLADYLCHHDIDRALMAGHRHAVRVVGYPGAIIPS